MSASRNSVLLFLIGMFSMTQIRIVGSIGISELFISLLAPVIFIQDINNLRRDGFMVASTLLLLTMVGCVVSGLANHTILPLFLKGFASPYCIWASLIVLHRILRPNIGEIKWFIVGAFISSIINIFVFQTGTSAGVDAELLSNAERMEKVMNRPLFLAGRVGGAIQLPVKTFYLGVPTLYSGAATIVTGMLAILLSGGSGRSKLLMSVAGAGLIFIGRRKYSSMKWLSRHVLLLLTVGLIGAIAFKGGYKYAATHGMLGEKAVKKYRLQTRGGESIKSILFSGRVDFFAGVYACCHRPFVGFGPWAFDDEGYYSEFLAQYGSEDDYKDYEASRVLSESRGKTSGHLLAGHSHIVGWWLWYGIFGFVFWAYILYLVINHFMRHITCVPQWFAILAATLPGFVWSIFFSPITGRVGTAVTICALLFAKAVGNGRMRLPNDMLIELEKKGFWK